MLMNPAKYLELLKRLHSDCCAVALVTPATTVCDSQCGQDEVVEPLRRLLHHPVGSDEAAEPIALGAERWIHHRCVMAGDESIIGCLAMVPSAGDCRQSVEQSLDFVSAFIREDFQLNQDLLNITDELATRYEELNLVYETEDELSDFGQQDDVLYKLVENCIDYLDVDLVTMLVPGKGIHKSKFAKKARIDNAPWLFKELASVTLLKLREVRQPIVVNHADDQKRWETPAIADKLLCIPIVVGNQVDGMLAAVKSVWHEDFTNSDRNILEVLARKASKVIQTNYDARTGLVKRVGLEYYLEQALADSRHTGRNCTVLQVDLDRLHVVNDLDHQAGDELIVRVSRLVVQNVRDTDTVASLGGGGFGILLNNCSLTEGVRVGESIRAAVESMQFEWHDHPLDVSVSVGIVQLTADSRSIEEVITGTEIATREAKEKGRNRVHVFATDSPELVRRREQLAWVPRIQDALREDRFELYAQPIARIERLHQLDHWEVLLRMRDDRGNIVPPGVFLPAAERYQLMPAVDRWVIRNTLETLAAHESVSAASVGTWAINLSGESLGDDAFLEFVKEQLARTGIAATTLCFEVTETSAVANLDQAKHFIGALRELGCRFSLDDFGTGFSSLKYLRELAVDYLKIDGSFVRNVHTDEVNNAMVSAIHQVGKVVGTLTVAEFVENEEILARLRDIGIDYAQGYGIGKPEPLLETLQRLGQPVDARYA